MKKEVDVIVPVYQPDAKLYEMLDALEAQTLRPRRILLINTGKAYFDSFLAPASMQDFTEKYPNIAVKHIRERDFDHGGTRRRAVRLSDAPVFVMMTQDAIPADKALLEHLTRPLFAGMSVPARSGNQSGADHGSLKNAGGNGTIAVVYARQLADASCGVLERASRAFNYPDVSAVKTQADLASLGVKTYFCSDVCAAYRRDIYDALGGFLKRAIFNEDMVYAAAAVSAGYAVRYEASARVFHSHSYTLAQQFRRNFDLGVSQAQHPEVFGGISSESEGKRFVLAATRSLWKQGELLQIPYFYLQCASKYAGYLLGKHYKPLPKAVILRCTNNRNYWTKREKKGKLTEKIRV